MPDAQTALAKVREALAARPTPGPWVIMPANAGVHCVARINAWEAVPPSDCELSHDSIDASFIAACSPANMTAILAHVDAQAAEIERMTSSGVGYSQQTVDALSSERDRLRAALTAAMEVVQRERTRIAYNAKGAPPAIEIGYADILRRLDAVIAQADAALGSER